jgi:hypothetical protein
MKRCFDYQMDGHLGCAIVVLPSYGANKVIQQWNDTMLRLFKCFQLQKDNKNVQIHTQEGHDGPEIVYLYIGPWGGANFNPGFFLKPIW